MHVADGIDDFSSMASGSHLASSYHRIVTDSPISRVSVEGAGDDPHKLTGNDHG